MSNPTQFWSLDNKANAQDSSQLEEEILRARIRQEQEEAREPVEENPITYPVVNLQNQQPAKKNVEKLYSIIFYVENALDFETLPADELVEKYLSSGSKRALFLDWSRRCVPGDMTSIGNYLVIRKPDA